MDGRLGRVFVGHEEQNRSYGLRPLLSSATVRKPTFWTVPSGFPLDQGREGACTAFGTAAELAAGPIHVSGKDAVWAAGFYRKIQSTDRAMGNHFPEGATTLATMKTARNEGLITGYRWAFGIEDVIDALMVGPVCLGVEWREGMYETNRNGRVVVEGPVVGGHFITAVSYDIHPIWGPVIGWLNSWGSVYGVADDRLGLSGGVGWITTSDLSGLLSRNGEAVVPADFLSTTIPATPYFASTFGATFHLNHRGYLRSRFFTSRDDALKAGLRPCRVCRP